MNKKLKKHIIISCMGVTYMIIKSYNLGKQHENDRMQKIIDRYYR